MKKPFRYLIIGLCVVIGVSILLGIGTLCYLHTDHSRIQILNAINRRIPGTVFAQSLNFSMMSGRIDIWKLQLADFFQEEAAACDHLSLSISWWQLIRGKLHIQSASIEKLDAKVSVDPDGTLNVSRIFSEPSDPLQSADQSGLFLPVVLDAVALTDATLRYEDPLENISICLENLDADLSADFLKQAGKAHIRIGSGQISSPYVHTVLGPVTFVGSLEDGEILPLHLSLLSPGLNADISGSISQIQQAPQLSLSMNIESELSALQQSLDLDTTLSGLVHATGAMSGSIENPDISLNLTCPQAKVSEYSLYRIQMAASLKDRVISLDSLSESFDKGAIHITGAADLRLAFPSGVFAAPDTRSALSADIHLALDSVKLSGIHSAATGMVTGMLSLQSNGTLDQPLNVDVETDIQAVEVSLHPNASPVNLKINGQARWSSHRLQIHHLNAHAGTTRLTAKGFWDASDHSINGEMTCQSDDLSSSLYPLGIPGATGSIRAQANLSGTLNAPVCSLKLKSSGLGFHDFQLGKLVIDADLEPSGSLRISTLSLKNQGSELTAKGEVPIFSGNSTGSRRPLSLTMAFHQMQPSDFFKSSVIQGIIDGNCKLEGTEKSLSGFLQIQAKDLKVQTVRLGNITGEFLLSEGRVQIQRLFLQNRRSHVDFSGNFQIFEPGGLSFHRTLPFRLNGYGSALIAEDFFDDVKGNFSMAAELEGTPGQVRGAVTLESGHLETRQKSFRQNLTSLQLVASFQDNKLTVSKARAAVAPGETLEATGWIAMDETFHFDFKADNIGIDHVEALAGIRPAGDGKMHLAFSGNGSLNHPNIQGEVVLNPFRFYDSSWDNARFRLDLVDQLASFHVESPISGSASYQFQTQKFTADLNFTQMELSPFFQSAGLSGIGGRLSGNLSGSGNLKAMSTLRADAVFSDLSLHAKGKTIVAGRNLRFGIQNEAIVVPQNHLILLEEGILDIGGEARPGQTVSLRVNADIPVNAARHFDDTLSDLRGNLVISALMKGSWYSPDIEAYVDIRNAGGTLDKSAQDIHDVNGRIHITPQALTIERIEGQLDSGRLTLTGKAGLDAFRIQDMDVQMTASQLPVKIDDTLDARLNADLTLMGTAQSPSIQGEIVILEGLYYKNVNLNPLKSLFKRERGFQVRQEIVFPDVIQNALLDIRIPPRNLFIVDNNLALLNLSPDMHITGTLQRPIIQGRTRVDSGSLQYQSTTFNVKKGFVDFTNPYTLESVIDIQSQATVQNWTVFLDISGPLDKLDLRLSSAPFLEDSDLLSLLITGKPARAAINKSSNSSASSSKMIADLLSASIGSDLKKASGLDILEVDSTGESRYGNDDLRTGRTYGTPIIPTNESRYGNDNPLKVTFGKIISPRITLKYSVESKGGITFQRAITEYMFIENILLSGFQDSRGVFGGEFKFRHEFR